MKIERLNEENKNLWEEFVKKNKVSKFYHSLDFKDSIEKTYKNCEAEYYLLINGEVKAIFPFFLVKSKLLGNRIISLPFLDNGGFLGKYDLKTIRKLLEKLKKIKNLKHIEIRLNSFMESFENNKKIFLNLNFHERKEKNQIFLELKGESELWEGFNRITRKGIKKAEKSELEIKEINNEEELKKFYNLYLKNMKTFESPQHSYTYFLNLFNKLRKNFKGLNCYKDKELIGSLIVLFSKNYVHASYNPSNGKYLRHQPNDLLHWEIIKWASKNKIIYFDMGQCESNAKEGTRAEGIFRFKKKWLGKVYDKVYFYYYLNENNKEKVREEDKLKKFRKLWSKIPLSVLKVIGPKIISQLGR